MLFYLGPEIVAVIQSAGKCAVEKGTDAHLLSFKRPNQNLASPALYSESDHCGLQMRLVGIQLPKAVTLQESE